MMKIIDLLPPLDDKIAEFERRLKIMLVREKSFKKDFNYHSGAIGQNPEVLRRIHQWEDEYHMMFPNSHYAEFQQFAKNVLAKEVPEYGEYVQAHDRHFDIRQKVKDLRNKINELKRARRVLVKHGEDDET